MMTLTSAITSSSSATDDRAREETPPVELKGERIEAAFRAIPSETRPKAERVVETATSSTLPARSRGIRLVAGPIRNRLATFVTEQRWHGYVTDVTEQTFKAIVYDVSAADGEEIEEVEFDRKDVHSLMRNLINPGAIFFWDIGYEVDPGDQRNRKSIISFPTIHRYTQKLVDAGKVRARARFDELGWGRGEQHNNESEERSRS